MIGGVVLVLVEVCLLLQRSRMIPAIVLIALHALR